MAILRRQSQICCLAEWHELTYLVASDVPSKTISQSINLCCSYNIISSFNYARPIDLKDEIDLLCAITARIYITPEMICFSPCHYHVVLHDAWIAIVVVVSREHVTHSMSVFFIFLCLGDLLVVSNVVKVTRS